MPSFTDTARCAASPEEVWKLLYDPARFPLWWEGIETVTPPPDDRPDADATFYPEGWPDFPMPQQVSTDSDGRRVTVSCLVSDLAFAWRLEPDGDGTRITVVVEIPEQEAQRLPTQRAAVAASLQRLALLATGAPPGRC